MTITPTDTTAGQIRPGDLIDVPGHTSGDVTVTRVQTTWDRGPLAGQPMNDKLYVHSDEGEKFLLDRDQRITRYTRS